MFPGGIPPGHSGMEGAEVQPVPVEQVLLTIQGALSIDNSTRSQAETLLKTWEADAAPGFLSSLLRIVEQHAAIDEVGAATCCVLRVHGLGGMVVVEAWHVMTMMHASSDP